jgi:hypothetical protein
MAPYAAAIAQPWREIELALNATQEYANGYTDVEVWADFTHESGVVLRRPAFWDGGSTWKVLFASPLAKGLWTWRTFCSADDTGLAGQTGVISCESASAPSHRFYKHGFWRMSRGQRNLVHADGRAEPFEGEIFRMQADGSSPLNLTNSSAEETYPSASPDATKILFSSKSTGNSEIFLADADGTDALNLTNNPEPDSQASWASNGSGIVFMSLRSGGGDIYTMNPNGGNLRRMTENPALDQYPSWRIP